jgi:hypothetical protein
VYPEYNQPDPTQGGRLHLVATAEGLKELNSVKINGEEMMNLKGNNYTFFDWGKAMYNAKTSQLWIAFHSRNVDWMDNEQLMNILVTDNSGNCVSGSYIPILTDLSITWITPQEDDQMTQTNWILHVHNYGNQDLSVEGVLFSGMNLNARASRTFPIALTSGGHAVIPFSSPVALTRGDLFTIGVYATDSKGQSVQVSNGGRVPDSRFSIEVWPYSPDCPVPSANDDNWNELKSHGIDTVFYSAADFWSNCHLQYSDVVNKLAENETFYIWSDLTGALNIVPEKAHHISAILLGDEVDGDANKDLYKCLSSALEAERKLPNVLTYQGGKTNRHSGEFSGITDIQGVDAYIGACAPAIIETTATLHVQMSWAFARNTRNNHMPLPSIAYSQLFFGKWPYQANANEIVLQLGSVIASGSKGMSLFESVQQLFDSQRQDWDGPIRSVFKSITNPTIRHILRTGDIQSLPIKSSDTGNPIDSVSSIVEVIRNEKHIMIVILNTNASGYSYLLCHIGASKHWEINDHTISKVEISLGADIDASSLNLANFDQVVSGNLSPVSNLNSSLSGNTLVLENVQLSGDFPVRILLIPYQLAGRTNPIK